MQNVLNQNKGRKDGPINLLLMLRDRWLAVFAFVAVGLLAVVGLNIAMPPSETPNLGLLSKKTEFLQEAHQDYNVLLIGTSKTYRGVDPVLLQQVAERHGCDVRAFNLGFSKLRLAELQHLQAQLSPEMFMDYDLILLSPMAASGIKMANWSSTRVQHFSDWNSYWVSLIDIWHTPMTKTLIRRIYYSGLLTGAFAYRQLGIGRLASAFRGLELGSTEAPSGDLFDGDAIVDFSHHGFVALNDEPSEQFFVRGQEILNDPGHFD
ncbi:MAG: hypothetical protein ACR2P3_13295, partial [Geminicoccaceae bacterium]